MKNLLGCEIQIFAVRPMWRSLIIRLARLQRSAGPRRSLRPCDMRSTRLLCDLLLFEVVLDATPRNYLCMTRSGVECGSTLHRTRLGGRPQVLGLVRSPL